MAFNQDLGWCVDDAVSLVDAFSGTPCESTPPAASPPAPRASPSPSYNKHQLTPSFSAQSITRCRPYRCAAPSARRAEDAS